MEIPFWQGFPKPIQDPRRSGIPSAFSAIAETRKMSSVLIDPSQERSAAGSTSELTQEPLVSSAGNTASYSGGAPESDVTKRNTEACVEEGRYNFSNTRLGGSQANRRQPAECSGILAASRCDPKLPSKYAQWG